MKTQKMLGLAITLCLGFSAFSACTPNNQMSANPAAVQPAQVSAGQNASQAVGLQAALANYHEVDASFSDTQRLAHSGQFQTKLLGNLLGGDDDDDDHEHDNGGLLDDVLGGGDSDSRLDLNLGVNANVDANLDSDNTQHHNGSGSSTGGSQGSQNTSHSRSDTSLGLNLDANAMLGLFDNSDFNEDSLEADVRAGLNLDLQLDDEDDQDSGRAWTQLNADALARLRSRNYDNNSWSQDRNESSNNYYARYANNSSQRNVRMSEHRNQANNSQSSQTSYRLEETSTQFNRTAMRQTDYNADGSYRTVTSTTTNYSNGEKLEIFENRQSSQQGNGTGNGTYRWTHANGQQDEGELRTRVSADGSLASYLSSEQGEGFMLREDAQGQAGLSIRDVDGWDDSWTQVDFNAMLSSMTRVAAQD